MGRVLAEKGPTAADRLKLLPHTDAEIAVLMSNLEAQPQPVRLIPVA